MQFNIPYSPIKQSRFAERATVTSLEDMLEARICAIEGLQDGAELHPVQQAWEMINMAQCGFCQAGHIVRAVALLRTEEAPSDTRIEQVLAAQHCHCGGQARIRQAIRLALGDRPQ